MNPSILPVEAIRERDIDLLLLEELNTDTDFCRWFINELSLPALSHSIGAWRSISDFGLGETDIVFSYQSGDCKIMVLLENKLDTSFQDLQYDRYCQRAETYIKKGGCHQAYSILIAPEVYCENQNDFESWITYENIGEQLALKGTKRGLFKRDLLKIGIEKLRRGYTPVNSEPVQKFWMEYWVYKEKHYPNLTMKKPGIVPHNSDWPMLFDERLPGMIFYHKLGQGNTDLTFRNFPDETRDTLEEHLPPEAALVNHNRSFSVRIFSGKINRTADFYSQLEVVNQGLKHLTLLQEWVLVHQELVYSKK